MKWLVKNITYTALLFSTQLIASDVKQSVSVLDKHHYPAANFLAYTEFELSGEPLAEALGLDLDSLDPNNANLPTAFDFTAGIVSYEYSEEAMYALNYQSSMGPHLVNGPLNIKRGGQSAHLNQRMLELAKAVGFAPSDIPLNMYPLSMPYVSGSPEFGQKVNTATSVGEKLDIITHKNKQKIQKRRKKNS